MYYYSAKSSSFYLEPLASLYDGWPEDLVEITKEDYLTFKSMPPEGKVLGSDGSGYPAWNDRVLSLEDKIEICSSRLSWVLSRIPLFSAPVDLGIATDEEESKNAEVQKCLVLLSRCKSSLESGKDESIPDLPPFLNS